MTTPDITVRGFHKPLVCPAWHGANHLTFPHDKIIFVHIFPTAIRPSLSPCGNSGKKIFCKGRKAKAPVLSAASLRKLRRVIIVFSSDDYDSRLMGEVVQIARRLQFSLQIHPADEVEVRLLHCQGCRSGHRDMD
jgi:hypothetical protein